MAVKSPYTQKELDDLRGRLEDERNHLQAQLTAIHEATFAATQSDISGEVSFDDENADAPTREFVQRFIDAVPDGAMRMLLKARPTVLFTVHVCRPDNRHLIIIQEPTALEAAQAGNIAILTVPYSAHRETLESVKDALQGKILIDVTVPLVPPKITKVQMPPAGSAAQEAHEILGENVMVTAAFQNISHQYLFEPGDTGCDVLVTGTGKEAREETLKIVAATGLKGWDAGPIENSVVVEGLTSVLLGINRLHGTKRAGIKITGVI